MDKITWILIWGVTALMARTTTAIRCYTCLNSQIAACGDPFSAFTSAMTCPAGVVQCLTFKVQARGASGMVTVVLRSCAPSGESNGCREETDTVALPDGSRVRARGSLCLCSTDLCNGGGASGHGRKETVKVTASSLGKVTLPGGKPKDTPPGGKPKGSKGEQFQPTMKLLIIAMATALMNILFN